ncbi:phosphate ABC transporter permease PstA [Propionibacteriaceae bacterium G1746]
MGNFVDFNPAAPKTADPNAAPAISIKGRPAVAANNSIVTPDDTGEGTVRIAHAQWWTKDLSQNNDLLKPNGGALHAIVGTLLLGLITSVIAVPIAVLGAIYLVEYARGKKFSKVVSFMVDILTGVPSIVAALFIFALLITTLGLGRSTLAASLSLVILMLPTVLRSTEEMLKLVPDSLREASYALGVPKWKTILSVVLPTSRKGILSGIVLGVARIMGETAPLIILLNTGIALNFNPLDTNMGSLPMMVMNAANVAESYPAADRAWGAALTLILIVMGLNLGAKIFGSSKSR